MKPINKGREFNLLQYTQ